ncbi:MAG TPA: patatin-like phospholipase family protein [Acidimicrobiales bacterium]|jgi:NTE family protein|nr:patatin-like phospholipase family protein [Acidimicrobiales bacterium]
MAETVDLVLEGGGVKGIGLVGALSVLEERGMTFARVAGASAGAIVGSLVAGGMAAAQLQELMTSLDYTRFRDDTRLDRVPVLGKGLSLWLEHGIYAGDYFHGWIREQLEGLGVRTFADLHRADPGSSLPADEQYKLVVMASDVSRGRLLRLPWDYLADGIDAPTRPVADAVRASMSIPFFYRPVTLDIPKAAPSVLVDGGMLSNFPVDTFDRTDGKPPRWQTIGIKLSAQQVPNQVEHVVKGDVSLAMGMLGTMQSWHDQMHLNDPAVVKRTIFVDTLGVNATDFSIDKPTQQKLFENGRAAAERFLATQG